ncbi:MAG: EMC3/TMCO1 family protein [Candidatus Woesearchaeota archaeon]
MIVDTYAFLIVVSAAMLMSLIITVVYKYTTNQKEMKHIKDEMKRLQKEMRKAKDDQKKMMEINNQLMKYNSQYMMKSFKSSLYTILPAILVFMLLRGHIAYDPISPGSEFSILVMHVPETNINNTGIELPQGFELLEETIEGNNIRYTIRAGEAGNYSIGFQNNGDRVEKEVIITGNRMFARAIEDYPNTAFRNIRIEYESLTIVRLPFWPREMNWLWIYIITAILTSMISRRVLNVY